MNQLRLIPHAPSFDIGNAVVLARAAELAYQPPDQIEVAAIRQWNYERFVFVDQAGTQAFLAADDRCILVCFRGTESEEFSDWMTDARLELAPGPMQGRVHAGFYGALSQVWRVVDQELAKLNPLGRHAVYLTGHSMGGALAILAAARWHDAGRHVQAIYTFGQPRTGDSAFARNFNFAYMPATFRVVNHHDLVTRIPPRACGYSHLGTLKYLTEGGLLASDIRWWQRFLDGFPLEFENLRQLAAKGVDNHAIGHYRALLERQLNPLPAAELKTNLRRFLRQASRFPVRTVRPRRSA